jgi:hypothetical protein
MKNLSWAIGPLAVAAVVASCGNNSQSGSLPFSGPSCPNGMLSVPGAVATTPACQQCTQNACVGQTGCFTTDCETYFNCICACTVNDSGCYSMCTLPSACMTCISNYETCGAMVDNGTGACAGQCGLLDAGGLVGG